MATILAPGDKNLSVSFPIAAASSNVTTAVLDLQAIAPNSNAWQQGRFVVEIPALPENTTGAGVTIALQCAPVSLTSGIKAPLLPPPGTFITPLCAQTITIPAVANGGSLALAAYFNLATDLNGSTYQFYQFLQTTPAGVATVGEIIVIEYISEY